MSQRRIILAGGSGFLGRALAERLVASGDEVIVLTRHPYAARQGYREVFWDGRTLGPWAETFEGAHAVVNFAGKNVNCRYTPEALAEINASRVDSVKVVAEAIRRCARPPQAWVQTGSMAIYGDAGDRLCDEDAPPGEGIPVDTCLRWEKAFEESPTPGVRRTWLRISFVLGRSAGALRFLEVLTKCFLGGTVGSGRQYISWIHEEDMIRVFLRAIDDASMQGVYNVATPHAVPNATLMSELRRVLRRPWCPPTPAWLMPLGCWLFRTEPVLALTGRRGVPSRLLAEGFRFTYPELPGALDHLYGRSK
ncbi:MAG: TIGR01777 family protein [Verrucomicrobia bacterium]|jgi:uncharacterized protein (TIGR01777 family)|nr:TIGR01777 family protein [Verrucomicrobiota bacterium]